MSVQTFYSLKKLFSDYWALRGLYIFIILEISTLWNTSLTNIFLPVYGYFIILLTVFLQTKVLILIKSNLSTFSFTEHTESKVIQIFLFSPRRFTFRSMTHFKLIFLKVWGMCLGFIVCFFFDIWTFSFSRTTCWKIFFSYWIALAPLFKNPLPIYMWVCFWTFYSVQLISMFIISLEPHCLDYSSPTVILEIR